MTPTLYGRWQTRFFLLGTLGSALTLLFMALFGVLTHSPQTLGFWKLPILLGYVAVFGLVWDMIYDRLQDYRWDSDWPMAFQFLAGLVEGLFIFALFAADWLPFVAYNPADDWWHFALHYGTIWQVTFWVTFGPLRIFFPRWRFRGGEMLPQLRQRSNKLL